MNHIWPKTLAKRDIGHIWERRSNRTYNFVYSVITILKMLLTRGWLVKGACGMGAVRLGAKTGFGMGRSLG